MEDVSEENSRKSDTNIYSTKDDQGDHAERSDNFGLGTFDDLTKDVEGLMRRMAPGVKFKLESDHNRKRLRFKFIFETSDNVGLFLGGYKNHLKMLKLFIRHQQVYPHDRFVLIELDKPGEENQHFWDRRVSKSSSSEDG